MRLGIFAKTFVRPTLDATLDCVCAAGLDTVQFNLSCAGLPTLPDALPAEQARRIGQAIAARGIQVAAVSGTFNMIDPDHDRRRGGLARLAVLASACGDLGARLITLCTGTRDPLSMWRGHPDNGSQAAWSDLVDSMHQAIRLADAYDLTLGVEPEVSNVIDSAPQARRLLDELGSPRVRIVMDPANLFQAGQLARMHSILDEAFELLGADVVLAHAKDLSRDGQAGDLPAGAGLLDYPYYLSLLRSIAYDGALVLHGLTEDQVPSTIQHLRRLIPALDC